jgi:hypothetical protein
MDQRPTLTLWPPGERGKTRNVYLGSSQKMSREEAQEKAGAMKREALGLSSIASPESNSSGCNLRFQVATLTT